MLPWQMIADALHKKQRWVETLSVLFVNACSKGTFRKRVQKMYRGLNFQFWQLRSGFGFVSYFLLKNCCWFFYIFTGFLAGHFSCSNFETQGFEIFSTTKLRFGGEFWRQAERDFRSNWFGLETMSEHTGFDGSSQSSFFLFGFGRQLSWWGFFSCLRDSGEVELGGGVDGFGGVHFDSGSVAEQKVKSNCINGRKLNALCPQRGAYIVGRVYAGWRQRAAAEHDSAALSQARSQGVIAIWGRVPHLAAAADRASSKRLRWLIWWGRKVSSFSVTDLV